MQDLIKRLEGRNLAHVARKTGINLRNLYRITSGQTKNPHYETVRKISEYLEQNK